VDELDVAFSVTATYTRICGQNLVSAAVDTGVADGDARNANIYWCFRGEFGGGGRSRARGKRLENRQLNMEMDLID
jgi:hypothetical protein